MQQDGTIRIMEHRITHACGHEQAHFIPGYPDQRARKARWLRTTTCRACFLATRRAAEAEAAVAHGTAIGELALADLAGSERQVAWATAIRARRLAALMTEGQIGEMRDHPCLAISEAKWWIDHRDICEGELLRKAAGLAGEALAARRAA